MTAQEIVHPTPTIVIPAEGSKLEQLHAQYADAKAQADDATARLKDITDGIKAELSAAHPEQRRVELRTGSGPALGLTYVETWRFDSTRFKKEHPVEYVTYAKQSGSWRLAVVKDGERE